MRVLLLSALSACSDYGLGTVPPEPPEGAYEPLVPVLPTPVQTAPHIQVDPVFYDFGAVDPWASHAVPITIRNVGATPLTVSELTYAASSAELELTAFTETNGPLPWLLGVGESREVVVTFVALDDTAEEGRLSVVSDDPQRPIVEAVQVGSGLFSGFQTGWYIVNDDTPYDLTTDPAHVVDYNGDSDAYWYEPSGVHGMTGSTDVAGDFAFLHDYIVGRTSGPTIVTGPLTFHEASTLQQMEEGSFSYVMCDFWMDAGEDPLRYTISTGLVDDGIRVIVNGAILGELTYNQTGSWSLANAVPGAVNTLVVILEDNARVEKYIYDLAFYKDGVIVPG